MKRDPRVRVIRRVSQAVRSRREGGETRSTREGDKACQPGSQKQGEKSHETIYERRRALHSKLSTRSRENKEKGRGKETGARQPEVISGAARLGNASRKVSDAHHADRAVQDYTRARTGEPSLPTQPRQGASPTLPGIIPRRADDLTRCRPRSPVTDHQVGQQPPTPAPSAISSRKKSQVDGQATIPLPSYASVVARRGNDKIKDVAKDDEWKLVQRRRHPTTERSPVNPSMEGRCYRCQARDHKAQTCREPVRCRLCRQNGHRQYACPRNTRKDARPEPPERTPSGLYACLVGEVIDADPTWTQIVECVQEISPSLTHPVFQRLVSGHILLQDLPKETWHTIRGWMYRVPGGGCIRWRRPRDTDGAFPVLKEIRRLEILGVPFGRQTRPHLEAMLGHLAMLRKIVCTELQSGDPNCMCVEVEVSEGTVIPGTIPLTKGWDAPTVRVVVLPSTPPRYCPHMMPTPGLVVTDRLAEKPPQSVFSPGLDDLEECSAYLDQATPPGPIAPQETVHTSGLTSSTVSPVSARSGHIETPSSAAIKPPPSATPLGETTDSAHQLANERAELYPSGEYMVTHTRAPSKQPLGDTLAPAPGVTTQGRFGGRVYESRRRF